MSPEITHLHARLDSGEFPPEKSARLARLPLGTLVCGYCCEDPVSCDCGGTEGSGNEHIVELRYALTRSRFARRPPGPAEAGSPGQLAVPPVRRADVA